MKRLDFPSTPVIGAAQRSLAAAANDYQPQKVVMTLLLIL